MRIRTAVALLAAGMAVAGCSTGDEVDVGASERFCDLMAELDEQATVAYGVLPDDVPHDEIFELRTAFFDAHKDQFQAILDTAPAAIAADVDTLVSSMQERLANRGSNDLTDPEIAAQARVIDFERSECDAGNASQRPTGPGIRGRTSSSHQRAE